MTKRRPPPGFVDGRARLEKILALDEIAADVAEIRRGMAAMDEGLVVLDATGIFDRYVCPFCSQMMIGKEQTLGHLSAKHTDQIVAQMDVFKAALEQ